MPRIFISFQKDKFSVSIWIKNFWRLEFKLENNFQTVIALFMAQTNLKHVTKTSYKNVVYFHITNPNANTHVQNEVHSHVMEEQRKTTEITTKMKYPCNSGHLWLAAGFTTRF